MYLNDKYRPNSFSEIASQEHVVNILKRVIKNPTNYPKTFLFNGPFGCGKTTLARIFGNEITKNRYVKEYDGRIVGNVESMKELRNFIDNVLKFKREAACLIFNEVQTISAQAQDFLLEMLEDNLGSSIYFVFTTTDADKIKDTVRSRCAFEFEFKLISPDKIKERLNTICEKESIIANDELIEIIIKKSKGHMRNAVNLLDIYRIDSESFKILIEDTTNLIKSYIFEKEDVLEQIKLFPVQRIKEDLNIVISDYILHEENVLTKVPFFENYMKFKGYIETIEDIIAVLNILKKSHK